VQKEKPNDGNLEEDLEPDTDLENSDNSALRYYYDDAHGYEDYDAEKAEEDEED
jgi:hypothetical protein